MKSWETIKSEIYFEDGSLRDIYICDTDRGDWEKWASLINEKYDVSFHNGRTGETANRIDTVELFRYWTDSSLFYEVNKASFKLRDMTINCYLHFESEIENDIDPREVKTEEDHQAILEYLKAVSRKLRKRVIVTSEMTKDDILLEM